MNQEQELSFQQRLSTCESMINTHQKSLDSMADVINDIKDNLLKRPSWSVSIIISLLLSICASLTVYVAVSLVK